MTDYAVLVERSIAVVDPMQGGFIGHFKSWYPIEPLHAAFGEEVMK